jgi:hypothetical protein
MCNRVLINIEVLSIEALILNLGFKSWDFTNVSQSFFWCLDYKTIILSMHFYSFQILCNCVSNKSSAHCDSFYVILFMKCFVCIMWLIMDVWFFSCIVWTMRFVLRNFVSNKRFLNCVHWMICAICLVCEFLLFFLWAMNNLWIVCIDEQQMIYAFCEQYVWPVHFGKDLHSPCIVCNSMNNLSILWIVCIVWATNVNEGLTLCSFIFSQYFFFYQSQRIFGFGPSSLFMTLRHELIMSWALFSHWMHKLQVVDPKFEIDSLYFNGKCQHAHNEWIYITSQCPFVLVLVVFEIPQNKKKKFVQFVLVYHLLSRG